jgi:predicted ATP-dependent endonuclease of OLD family
MECEETTILVGANNIGKTNMLDALAHRRPERTFSSTDLRDHSQAESPKLEFRLSPDSG